MNTQTVIITGGATGLGYAIAETFLHTGANVTLNGRTRSKLETAAQKLQQPERIHLVAGDITDPAFVPKLVDETVSRFGRVDVLINNAGIFAVKPFIDYGIDELDQYLGYVRGTFALTQAVVNQMRVQRNGGAIVNIGTILTFHSSQLIPSSAPIMAKAAITAMAKNLSFELASDKIRINTVAPGVVQTPLHGETPQEALNSFTELHPLGRMGTPKDIADAVLYLANASWVTGVVLPVDGGVAAGGDGINHKLQAA
ncbi:SDR family oxidoreductase [Acaryochloris sp. IP29b_bin.137]|uniref:SDR family NAD(P)-dependent oxidoreductase n=1 Tax=Acaryochloris sp. IP29b_bin.137 TaxID=2969217 RepID=UPI0026258C9D|nr:SDR family oxidoreductase [Acaryochloris sp. IP29b_bin.137]